jgi:hypothetical protein
MSITPQGVYESINHLHTQCMDAEQTRRNIAKKLEAWELRPLHIRAENERKQADALAAVRRTLEAAMEQLRAVDGVSG